MLLSAGALPLLALSEASIGRGVIYVICLVMCVAVHEFGHAYVADRLGDPLPRQQGRVTLNPLVHADLLGTILFPLILATGGGPIFGWGKPVEWTGNPRYLTRRFSLRAMHVMVSIAGPAMNLLLALLLSVVVVIVGRFGGARALPVAMELGVGLISMNFMLMFFNLLPIPPLDGRSFLHYLPRQLDPVKNFLFQYGAFVFLALVLTGPLFQGRSLLDYIMSPFMWISRQYLTLLMQVALSG
jgi:Zn-dependent protease